MKQIRQSIFETNSSSTHTFSIKNIIQRNNILNPNNGELIIDLSEPLNEGYDDGSCAGNISSKLILVLSNNPDNTKNLSMEEFLSLERNKNIINLVKDLSGLSLKFISSKTFDPFLNWSDGLNGYGYDYANDEEYIKPAEVLFRKYSDDELAMIIICNKFEFITSETEY